MLIDNDYNIYMIIHDKVYGNQVINEKVIIDLIRSKSLQRLKRIKQAGISAYIISYKKHITRFDHSVGVMILLKKFGASLKEQIAGLIHDVSHTAFSHVADFVFSNTKHEFHEWHYSNLLLQSEMPKILKHYRLNVKDFLNIKKLKLLERPIPDLCADRIDYFLNEENALRFAKEFLKQNKISWYSPKEVYYYSKFAEVLKKGLKKKIITKEDFFTDDETLMSKLRNSKDLEIRHAFEEFFKPIKLEIKKGRGSIWIKSKPRYVDPKIIKDRKLVRLSDINKKFKNYLIKEIEWMREGFQVRITTL